MPAVAEAHRLGRLRLGTTDAFFFDRLCGSFRTDRATASHTGLLDLASGTWSRDLCALHGVPVGCLPEITAVDAGFGAIDGTPVQVSIVDQQAALFGHGCRRPGDAKITFGTGAFLLAVTGHERPGSSHLLPTIAWSRAREETVFAIEGGVYDAGAALEWARRLGLYETTADLDGFSGPSALSRGLVFVPALPGLAAPYWDRRAAPLFIGMDAATGRADLVRAVLEGIAMLTVGLIEAAAADIGPIERLSIDGGLSQSTYFGRFLAAASGREICVPAFHEMTALGLAGLCGVDVGFAHGAATRLVPDGSVSPADHQRFAAAAGKSLRWR